MCFAEYALGGAAQAEPARVASAAGLDGLPDELLAARLDLPYYLGFAEYFCERYEDAARHLRRGIALARTVGQGQFVVSMMVGLAQALERLGRLREALNTAEAAVEASRLSGNRQAVGFALVAEAWTAAELGDVDHARSAAEEAVALLGSLDESVFTRATHAHVGVIWLEIGEPDRCIEQLRAAGIPDFPQIEPGRRGWLYTVLARAELEGGDRAAAAEWVARAEETVRGLETAARGGVGAACPLAADARRGRRGRSRRTGAPGRRARGGGPRTGSGRSLPDACGRRARAGGRQRAGRAAATAAQRALAACEANRHRDEAARHLRRLGRRVTARQRRFGQGPGLGALSGRELEIADRVALGSTNRQIADDLFLSQKTVEGHLTSVFAKLGVSSRAEVAEAVGRARAPQS